jgi:hypothetical protein
MTASGYNFKVSTNPFRQTSMKMRGVSQNVDNFSVENVQMVSHLVAQNGSPTIHIRRFAPGVTAVLQTLNYVHYNNNKKIICANMSHA